MVNKKLLFFMLCSAVLCGCAKDKPASTNTIDSDELVSLLEQQQTGNVGEELNIISSVISSREQAEKDSYEALIEESISLSEAERLSEEEAMSIEESIKASELASIAESSSIQASIEYSIAASEAESRYIEASKRDESIEASKAESEAASLAESSSIKASIEHSIAESESIRQSQEAQSIADSIAQSIAQSQNDDAGKLGSDSLTEFCAGSHLTPYGVSTIDDSDTPYINKLYKDTVVIGDSRVEGVTWVLEASRVFYLRGAHASQLHDLVNQAAGMYPKKALFFIGLNDMAVYEDNVSQFVMDYKDAVNELIKNVPDCKIFIHNQPDVPQRGIESFPSASRISMYNAAMKQMCEDNGWTFVDGSTYLQDSYFGSDGLHFSKAFYRYWIQDMAVQMDLWGDLNK